MVENRVPLSAAQQRLGHSRPDLLLKYYAHVLDGSAQLAAETLSTKLSPKKKNLQNVGSKTTSPGSGSQTAASEKQWVM